MKRSPEPIVSGLRGVVNIWGTVYSLTMDQRHQYQTYVDYYDAVNASREDFDFYLSHFPDPPCTILDIGCGTGTFALDLAKHGYSVTAVDPEPDMIAAARAKAGAGAVRWVTGFATGVVVNTPVDIAVMTGHAFQCLLDDSDIELLFQSVAARLSPSGSFWFETRNARTRPWTTWMPNNAAPAIPLPDGSAVKVVHTVLKVDGDYVTFEEACELNSHAVPVTSQSTLRFASFEKIEHLARANGLHIADAFGDWTGGPLRETSPEIILRLQKPQ